jgi:phage-related minor tail protein
MNDIDMSVATNGENLKTWADLTGLTVDQFKQKWGTDAMGAIQMIIGGMGDAKAGGENLNVILDELGITQIRTSDTMRRLTNASQVLNDAVAVSNDEWKKNEALTKESDKRYETTAAKMQQLKGAITELCVSLGEILLPIINNVVEKLQGWVNKLSELDPKVQTVILVVAALVAGLAPLIITIGKVTSAIGTMLTVTPKVVSGFNTMKAGVINAIGTLATGCNDAIARMRVALTAFGTFAKTALSGLYSLILAHPVAAVVAAVVALIVVLYNKCEWFRDGVNKVVSKIGEFVKKIPGFFQELPGKIVSIGSNIMSGLLSGIQSGWNSLKRGISGICDSVVGWFQTKLKINSPSKVIADKIGKGISEGLGYGVEKNEDEAIKPMNKVMNRMISGVSSPSISHDLQNRLASGAMSITSSGDGTVLGKLDKILTAIEKGQILTLDGKALVGGTVNAYDTALGQRRMLAARGAV